MGQVLIVVARYQRFPYIVYEKGLQKVTRPNLPSDKDQHANI